VYPGKVEIKDLRDIYLRSPPLNGTDAVEIKIPIRTLAQELKDQLPLASVWKDSPKGRKKPVGQNVIVRILVMLNHAAVMAAGQDFMSAEKVAQQAVAQARTVGLVRLELEASLALGQIQMRAKKPVAACARLQELEKSARASGFELIARKAAQTAGAP
jgi:hypothetical protein